MTTSGDPAPAGALTCPRCDRPATPSPEVQVCAGCQGRFTLRAGALLDPTVRPPALENGIAHIKVKAAGLVLMRMGVVDQYGVAEGPLDPIIGMVPMEKSGVAFDEIYSVAVWRRISVVPLVVGLVLLLPLVLLLVYAAFPRTPMFLVVGLPFDLLFAFVVYRTVILKANLVRIVGKARTIRVRFDNPLWRRQKFHDELLRRAGITASPIP